MNIPSDIILAFSAMNLTILLGTLLVVLYNTVIKTDSPFVMVVFGFLYIIVWLSVSVVAAKAIVINAKLLYVYGGF